MSEGGLSNLRCTCGEPVLGDDALLKPCPKCGRPIVFSDTPILNDALGSNEALANLQTEILPYARELMDLATRLIDEGRYSLAVILVHTACEVATGQLISNAFDSGGARHLKQWVIGLRRGNNLANRQIRELYKALTGDDVVTGVGAEWSSFTASSTLRNNIIHEGKTASETDAKASHRAASALLRHLESGRAPSP
jgi:hypothetical protein